MPFVSIPVEARRQLLVNAVELRATRELLDSLRRDSETQYPLTLEMKVRANESKAGHLESWATGFLAALRCELRSEAVGLLVMDYDQVLAGVPESETYTRSLLHLTLSEDVALTAAEVAAD